MITEDGFLANSIWAQFYLLDFFLTLLTFFFPKLFVFHSALELPPPLPSPPPKKNKIKKVR